MHSSNEMFATDSEQTKLTAKVSLFYSAKSIFEDVCRQIKCLHEEKIGVCLDHVWRNFLMARNQSVYEF